MVTLSYYCFRPSLLLSTSFDFFRDFSSELSRENKVNLSWELYLTLSVRCQNICSLRLSKKIKIKSKKIKIIKKFQETKLRAIIFHVFRRDHLRFGIVCGPIWGPFPIWRSFAFGYYLRCSTLPICVDLARFDSYSHFFLWLIPACLFSKSEHHIIVFQPAHCVAYVHPLKKMERKKLP